MPEFTIGNYLATRLATMNVGAFSALNGVAGAYAERLPVIFVASGYNTNDASANHLVHHSPQLIEWGARVARANTRPHQTT